MLIIHFNCALNTIFSASGPPLVTNICFKSCMRSIEARSCFFLMIYNASGRCLLRAGPKLFEAFFRFSMAERNIALFEETKHFQRSIILVLTSVASTEFSSTIMLGSKIKLKYIQYYFVFLTQLEIEIDLIKSLRVTTPQRTQRSKVWITCWHSS